jgi:hypothetical protein
MPVLLLATACSESFFCTDESVPAVEVEVRDRATAELIPDEARGVVKDGAYQDSLQAFWRTEPPVTPISYSAAHERPGTYSARIEVAGYQPWDSSGIVVTRDECHVRTARFTAALNPAP